MVNINFLPEKCSLLDLPKWSLFGQYFAIDNTKKIPYSGDVHFGHIFGAFAELKSIFNYQKVTYQWGKPEKQKHFLK